jgi:PIN domain nuclease of toxin-antitoxin system
LPITADHALAAGDLPRHHDDPFDRMLVAQAIAEGLTEMTRDARLRAYQVAVLRAQPTCHAGNRSATSLG